MFVHQVPEMGCSASLTELAADESRRGQMDEARTWDDRGWRMVLWGVEADAPERRSVVPC
jgi:hypothetical protein